ncbi:MAG TPA: gephyrin-like molybdotransferase Glp [bacterium]|jgi:molybdopterin molybdotransferase|nr:gephyrin-like molybdotransferase Glp [bacterium]
MLTPEQALREIMRHSRPLPPARLALDQCWNRILAAPVRAPHPYPRFDNAALDGYAVRARDCASASEKAPVTLALQGSQYAGRIWRGRLKAGQALHLTTGAPMPRGTDALVPYEAVRVQGRRILVDSPLVPGQNLRFRGEDGAQGSLLALRGERLHARRLAMLASFGVDRVRVLAQPRVALAASGDEVLAPGEKPAPGKIFDGNGPALRGLLLEAGLGLPTLLRLPDNARIQARKLAGLLESCDVLLVAGGMSVGKRDFSKAVLEGLGVRRIFWKVAQKPGKPLYFGVRGKQLIFGLPGNPAALVACFTAYVAPSLRALEGQAPLKPLGAILTHSLPAGTDKALLLKARVLGSGTRARVTVLRGQGSHLMRSLAEGNALVLRKAGAAPLKKGARVPYLPLE